MTLVVNPQGQAHGLYTKALNLAALGMLSIRRASHVKPNEAGRWWAAVVPMDGPRLGPFEGRNGILTAETTWLEEQVLVGLPIACCVLLPCPPPVEEFWPAGRWAAGWA